MFTLLSFLLGGLAGYSAAKTYLFNQFKQSATGGLTEIVSELNDLSERALATGSANLELAAQLESEGNDSPANALRKNAHEMLEALLIDEDGTAQGQRLMDSLNLPLRKVFAWNMRVKEVMGKWEKA